MNNNSRQLAWKLLLKVFVNNSFSNILLNEIANKEIDEKFKNLIFAIVHGTITYKIYLEYLTNKLINPKNTPIEIKVILWMSIYQLKFLTFIPQYAILNEAASLAKSVNPKFTGLVNACLQKSIREADTFYQINIKDEERKFCVEYAFPYELFAILKKDYDLEIAQKVVIDSIIKPPISFRVNTIKTTLDAFLKKHQAEYELQTTNVENCLIANKPIVKSEMYKQGLITIQDQASILVAQILNPKPDSKVLDMCSAPGGKLTHLGAIMQNTGTLIGYEISAKKIPLIQQNIDRLGLNNITLIAEDATKINQPEEYNYILLDAPCSGFGVLKRKPEIKLNINPKSLVEIVQIQANLLETAYLNLKHGGEMVYSTCTINQSENQQQIQQFLAKHQDMTIIFELQLFGYENNTDGFYMCKMLKK